MNTVLAEGVVVLVSNGHPWHEISVKSLAAFLRRHGIRCRVVYLNWRNSVPAPAGRQLVELLRSAALAGFSLMTKDVPVLGPLMREVRALGLPVVAGGVHPTAATAHTLAYCDYACVGEGEVPLLALYRWLVNGEGARDRIPNLAFMEGGEVRLPSEYWAAESLEELPSPDYALEDSLFLQGDVLVPIPTSAQEKKALLGIDVFLYYSARGCPNACAYCSNSLYHALARKTGVRWFRTLSPGHVLQQLRENRKSLPSHFLWFNDDDFMARPVEELREICTAVREEFGARYNINATPNSVTEAKMDILASTGVRQIAFGIQSGSDRVLRGLYKRRVLSETVVRAAEIVANYRDHGVMADYGFILDNPYEDETDQRETMRLFLRLPQPVNLSLYSLSFFPGTALTQRALRDGIVSEQSVLSGKDYREEITPSFTHALLQAAYKTHLDGDAYAFLLSDAVFVHPENRYPREILANSFLSEAVRDICWLAQGGAANLLPDAAPDVDILAATRLVSLRFRTPQTVARGPGDGLRVLQYQEGFSLTFRGGSIVQVQGPDGFRKDYKPIRPIAALTAVDVYDF